MERTTQTELMTPHTPPDRIGQTAHVERGGQGFPVVLLHGWGAHSGLFESIATPLQSSFDVIVPDFPGFGHTPPPPEAWSVREYTAWLVALLDELGIERAHFVGHSFGGRVSIVLANEHPERVAKLVLTDSAGIRPRRPLAYYLKVYSYKLLRVLAQRPSTSASSPLSRLIPKPVREWAAAQVAKRGSADYQQASGTVRQSLVRVVNEDLQGLLPHIAAPTLLIWGENDEDTPLSDGKTMERLIPDAGLVVFEGAGHYAHLEQPVRFCRIIETFFQQS